jgi:hypothetical protein
MVKKVAKSGLMMDPLLGAIPGLIGAVGVFVSPVVARVSREVVFGVPYEVVDVVTTVVFSPRDSTPNVVIEGVTFGARAVPGVTSTFAGLVAFAEAGPAVMIRGGIMLAPLVGTTMLAAVDNEPDAPGRGTT